MKSKYVLFGAVIFLVFALLVIYWKRHDSPVLVVGAPLPPVVASCTPAKHPTDDPHTVCKQCGSSYNNPAQSSADEPNWDCCPDGYEHTRDNNNHRICRKL